MWNLLAGPALSCLKMPGAGEKQHQKMAHWVTSDCPFCLSARTILFFLYSRWSHTRGATMIYLMASGWK